MASSRKITLLSSDGVSFEVERSVAALSRTIMHVIEDDCVDTAIPVPNVTSEILAKVIEYCEKHVESATAEDCVNDEDLRAWDAEFVKVDEATVCDLIMAANYLNIKSLLDLTCQKEADIISPLIKGKTLEEICRILGMENEITLEELRTILSME